MLHRIVSIGLLLAALTSATFTQAEERRSEPFRRYDHVVQAVELVQTEGGDLELVVSGFLVEGCDTSTIIKSEITGVSWIIDLYRQVPFDENCPMYYVPLKFEEHLDASFLTGPDTDSTTATQVIVINGNIYGFEMAGDDTTLPTLSENFVRGDLPYTHITTRHTAEGTMEIKLTGVLSDGCQMPVYRTYEDWHNPGFAVVDAYTVFNIAASCLQAEVPFEVVMTAPVFETLTINGISVPFDLAMSAETQTFVKQRLQVDQATAEWAEGLLPNIKVTVTGTVDGCEDPIQLAQQPQVDNTFMIEVVRVIREGQACTMIARAFTQEIYLAPDMTLEAPIAIFVNGIDVAVEQE